MTFVSKGEDLVSHRACLFAAALAAASAALGQPAPSAEPTIPPGDNLVVEGVPAIPAALADEVWRYTEFRTGGLLELAPDAAGDADLDALRQRGPGSPGEVSRRRAHADDVFPRAGERRPVRPEDRRLVHLLEGHRRQRVLPDLPLRLRRRERDAADRRQVAQHRGAVVPRRRSGSRTARHAARATTSTSTSSAPGTRRATGGSSSSPAAAGRSPTGRPTTGSSWSSRASRSTRPISGWPTSRRARRRCSRRRRQREGRLQERGVLARRQGSLPDRRRRLRVPAACLHGPRDEKDRAPDARHRRRGGHRPLRGRNDARLRHEREGRQRPPSARHGDPPRAAGRRSFRSAMSPA